MATVAPTGEWIGRGVYQTTWSTLTSGDVGGAESASRLPDKTIFVSGTLDGGGVTLQGSNNTATGPWGTLNDPQGNALTLTVTGTIEAVLENTRFVRPTSTGGAGSVSYTLYMVSRADS